MFSNLNTLSINENKSVVVSVWNVYISGNYIRFCAKKEPGEVISGS